MSDIVVKLNINPAPGKAAVTCDPAVFSANRGNQQIKWKPGGNEGFTFYSLTGLSDKPPFSGLNVTDDEITINDNDQAANEYSYTIVVIADANQGQYSTQVSSPAANTTPPCIKNQ